MIGENSILFVINTGNAISMIDFAISINGFAVSNVGNSISINRNAISMIDFGISWNNYCLFLMILYGNWHYC